MQASGTVYGAASITTRIGDTVTVKLTWPWPVRPSTHPYPDYRISAAVISRAQQAGEEIVRVQASFLGQTSPSTEIVMDPGWLYAYLIPSMANAIASGVAWDASMLGAGMTLDPLTGKLKANLGSGLEDANGQTRVKPTEPGNALLNGNFEATPNADGTPPDWTNSGTGTALVDTLNNGVAVSGKYWCKLAGGGTPGPYLFSTPPMSATPGNSYMLSASIRSDGASAGAWIYCMIWFSKDDVWGTYNGGTQSPQFLTVLASQCAGTWLSKCTSRHARPDTTRCASRSR